MCEVRRYAIVIREIDRWMVGILRPDWSSLGQRPARDERFSFSLSRVHPPCTDSTVSISQALILHLSTYEAMISLVRASTFPLPCSTISIALQTTLIQRILIQNTPLSFNLGDKSSRIGARWRHPRIPRCVISGWGGIARLFVPDMRSSCSDRETQAES